MTVTEDTQSVIPPIGNKKIKARKEAFCKFVQENKNKPFFICAHDNPDPDALASAMGMSHILTFLGVEQTFIYYVGEISRPQNRAMQNVLNIPAKKWNKDDTMDPNGIIVFVDCTGHQKNMSIPVDPHIAVDHHKMMAKKEVLFLHDEIGACSTLITDLMLSINTVSEDSSSVCFDPDGDGLKELATALAIGIKTDTLDFRSETTTEDDFKAYKMLSRFLSDDKFHKIVNYELPPYIFDYERVAWENKSGNSPNLITGLGFVIDSRSDCIPYLADKMMRLQGIQTVVVYAIVGNSVRASVRTNSASIDVQNLINELFGEANGGAKQGIGGARVEFNVFSPGELADEERERLWELTKATIEKKFEKVTQK